MVITVLTIISALLGAVSYLMHGWSGPVYCCLGIVLGVVSGGLLT